MPVLRLRGAEGGTSVRETRRRPQQEQSPGTPVLRLRPATSAPVLDNSHLAEDFQPDTDMYEWSTHMHITGIWCMVRVLEAVCIRYPTVEPLTSMQLLEQDKWHGLVSCLPSPYQRKLCAPMYFVLQCILCTWTYSVHWGWFPELLLCCPWSPPPPCVAWSRLFLVVRDVTLPVVFFMLTLCFCEVSI